MEDIIADCLSQSANGLDVFSLLPSSFHCCHQYSRSSSPVILLYLPVGWPPNLSNVFPLMLLIILKQVGVRDNEQALSMTHAPTGLLLSWWQSEIFMDCYGFQINVTTWHSLPKRYNHTGPPGWQKPHPINKEHTDDRSQVFHSTNLSARLFLNMSGVLFQDL